MDAAAIVSVVFSVGLSFISGLLIRHFQNLKNRNDEDRRRFDQALREVRGELEGFKLYSARNYMITEEFNKGIGCVRSEIKELRELILKRVAGCGS